MKVITLGVSRSRVLVRSTIAIACVVMLIAADLVAIAGSPNAIAPHNSIPTPFEETTIPADQLDALVAPIALFPDDMLSQTLVASTYPLELIQLQQWLAKNPDLAKDQKKLADAVKKQPWDASIQAMAPLPDLVKRLTDDIQWTTDLGNAFLAQQSDVMDAIQRMRRKAQDKGSLQSNQQQKVETQTVESKQVIVIEQSNPQVVYVPSYDPQYVYGPPAYPYPSIYYPPYYPGTGAMIAASAISFGVGWAMGAAWGGGWGWGCGWGGNDININNNNNFNRNTNIQGGNRVNNIGSGNRGGNKWQHNPSHRGGAPYGDRGTANRFGGTTRGDSLANRQRAAQRDIGRQGGNLGSVGNRGGVGDRGGVGNRGGVGDRNSGLGDRGGAGNRGGVSDRSSGISNRGGSGGFGNAGGDRVGNRSIGSSGSSGLGNRGGGFGGGNGGFNGASARSSSSRGSSSLGSSRSGGFGGGGGSRGGGGGFGGGGGGRGGGGGGRRR